MITLPQFVIDGLESGRFSVRHLFRASLGSGDYGLWDDCFGVVYDGVTYKPMAGNMQVQPVPGSTELRAEQLRITLSGLDSDALTLMDGDVWHQKPATVMVAFTDTAGLIAYVQPSFTGFIDQAMRSDQAGSVSTLVVTLEASSRELGRASGRKYSDSDQRSHGSPTDTFFAQLATSNANTDIYWGQETPKSGK